MDWKAQAGGDKLMSPEEAVSVVKSGDTVGIAPFTTTPFTLCDALFARCGELENRASTTRPGSSPGSRPRARRLTS